MSKLQVVLVNFIVMSDEEELLEDFVELEEGTLIRDTWGVVRSLGKGAYGHVYHVINIKNGTQAALKAESKAQSERVLKMEKNVLQGFKGIKDTIQLISMGTTDTYSYIVMTMCGADLTRICTLVGTLSDGTLIRLGIRTLLALKQLHEIGFIHRDVKPCNFAVSTSQPRIIHVFDFGMTRKYAYRNEKNEWLIKRRRNRVSFRGTLRYCSLAVHKRLEQGRVDDLWSWSYMIVELRDPLPWAHLTHPETVLGVKEETSIEKLCKTGTSLIFLPIMKHFQTLSYFDRPDYQMIFNLLLNELKKTNVNITDPYDWDGKITEPGVEEKIAQVCDRLGVKFKNFPKTESFERSESDELLYLQQQFDPHPEDVPGGEKYEEKRKKGQGSSLTPHNNASQARSSASLITSKSDAALKSSEQSQDKLNSSKRRAKKGMASNTSKDRDKNEEKDKERPREKLKERNKSEEKKENLGGMEKT
ncbi:unnamed protein product [Cylicocyclus nassatus]|uniref:Protein kinase domain-containing protein n=1 Tax=Cylicocyclus nassatus TaxID=53992 RepID=A0AA36DK92_CYLNA|nr:unnamed protein product [Cylicocyclus nassatus]